MVLLRPKRGAGATRSKQTTASGKNKTPDIAVKAPQERVANRRRAAKDADLVALDMYKTTTSTAKRAPKNTAGVGRSSLQCGQR
jgi:hypothetical protein